MTKIIAFEGIDGTGKTVQLERLAKRLQARGLSVKTIGFPVYDSYFGGMVGQYLSGKGGVRADEVDQKSMALWFALDRFDAFRSFSYQDADILLINRYVLSNAVYQSIRACDLGKPDLLDFVLALEYDHFGIPRPDAYIVLDMELEHAAQNVDKKGFREYVGNTKDVYESVPSIQQRARMKYRAFAQRLPNVHLIPCMQDGKLKSIEDVGALIDGVINEMIPQKWALH